MIIYLLFSTTSILYELLFPHELQKVTIDLLILGTYVLFAYYFSWVFVLIMIVKWFLEWLNKGKQK